MLSKGHKEFLTFLKDKAHDIVNTISLIEEAREEIGEIVGLLAA